MFTPQRVNNPGRARTGIMRPIPAPVGGWNARDPITKMGATDAVQIDDWFPQTSKVVVRPGSAQHVTGIGGGTPVNVETLITYSPPSGNDQMFGFAGTSAYDMSNPGAVGAAVLSGLNNAQWDCTNFSNSAGNFLLCVNGADDMQMYNGTTWTPINGTSTPSITNISTEDLVGVCIFKERPFYVEQNSLNVWYPAIQAFAGALTKFTLASVVKKGGYLVAMGTWPINNGQTVDDFAVFITSKGEVAVYRGTDPASASTWALVGVYQIGKPIGRRCFMQFGNDLLINTTDGVVPASKALVNGLDRSTLKSAAITDKIQGAMAQAVKLYGGNLGWQLTLHSDENALLLNVPLADGIQQQYVMNTITKAWCRFTKWPAGCFETFNGELYFGTKGEVRKAWSGTADLNDDITAELVSAFNSFGVQNLKQFTAAQPLIGWDSNPASIRMAIDTDYKIVSPPDSEISLQESDAAKWDSGEFDAAIWGGEIELQEDWHSVTGEGIVGALHLLIRSGKANIELSATNVLFSAGGIIG